MPIRFRRTLRVAPGVKLNFSKSGVSTTVGPKGFHFTFGKRGVRRTVSIPGTGVSEVDYIKKNETEGQKERKAEREEEGEAKKGGRGDAREAHAAEARAERKTTRRAVASSSSNGLRNAFVLLGILVFFFAGAAVLGLIPAHFLSNSLQYLAHMAQTTGH